MHRTNPDIIRRCRCLAQGRQGTGPVVYWMSRDQRLEDNWSLLWAQQEAIIRHRGLVIVFCLSPDYPGANFRHSSFMLKGLADLADRVTSFNIGFRLLQGDPVTTLPRFLNRLEAHTLVTDFDPVRIKQQWQEQMHSTLSIPLYQVDGHNIIPAWTVSEKKEYAAYTIRPKIRRLIDDYLTDIPSLIPHPFDCAIRTRPIDALALARSVADQSVGEVSWLRPGETAARAAAEAFLEERLATYAVQRNDPCTHGQSGLSPYLHFGQLAPQRLAWMVSRSEPASESCDVFLEELIVRRELADNFCLYEPAYDRIEGFPAWAQKSLHEHWQDKREYTYSLRQFEAANTHEALWNRCQQDLVELGKLHGYLRMYWAKKILEWSHDPGEALVNAIVLNDRYSLDGRDPNGYTGIAWSIGGVHDRAWQERPVFGKIRYMNEAGCRRKFKVDAYINAIHQPAPRHY